MLIHSTVKITCRNHIPTCDDQSRLYSARTQGKESNHDDNTRSLIKFKVDIVIPVVENTAEKYHLRFHKRVSDRESSLYQTPTAGRFFKFKINDITNPIVSYIKIVGFGTGYRES